MERTPPRFEINILKPKLSMTCSTWWPSTDARSLTQCAAPTRLLTSGLWASRTVIQSDSWLGGTASKHAAAVQRKVVFRRMLNPPRVVESGAPRWRLGLGIGGMRDLALSC